MCECSEINPHLKIKSGGTILFTCSPIIVCTICKSPVRDFCFMHQCDKLKNYICYSCLRDKGVCRKCGHYYTCMFRKLKNDIFLQVNI